MRLTLFEILFGAIVVVLAFLPIIFLVYLKHHSEVLKNFELRRNRQTFRYKFFLILLGISISAFYFLVFTLTFGMLYFPVFLASLAGTLLSGWVMYLLCKKFDTHSCSTLLIFGYCPFCIPLNRPSCSHYYAWGVFVQYQHYLLNFFWMFNHLCVLVKVPSFPTH